MSTPIYEFIVLRQTNTKLDLNQRIKVYDQAAHQVDGFIASRHYRAFLSMKGANPQPVYILLYQWAERETIGTAFDYLSNVNAISQLLEGAEIIEFALTEQNAGTPLHLANLVTSAHVLELIVAQVSTEQEEAHQQANERLQESAKSIGLHSEAVFQAVIGQDIEGLHVSLRFYNQSISTEQIETLLTSDVGQTYRSTMKLYTWQYAAQNLL